MLFTSPGYPDRYPSRLYCTWEFETLDHGHIIVLETLDSMIYNSENCTEDYVEATDIVTQNRQKWCGNTRPFFTSTSRLVHVVMATNYKYETRGFQLRAYQASRGKPCSRVLQANTREKSIFSPGYPIGYYDDLNCVYDIEAPNDARVQINFEESEIETSKDCDFDQVTVSDLSLPDNTEQRISTFCGSTSFSYQSATNKIRIKLTTNSSKTKKGFKVNYKAIPRDDCTATLTPTDQYSYLMSPGYASRYYSNLTCLWRIIPTASDPLTRIELTTESLNIQGSYPTCSFDKMTVRDDDNTVLGTTCGRQMTSYNSAGPSLSVEFTTDGSIEEGGFRLRYRLVPRFRQRGSCGGAVVVGASSQAIQAPGYPVAHLEAISCTWTITAGDGRSRIKLFLTIIDIELDDECRYDSLQAFDGGGLTDPLAIWCGLTSGQYVQSSGSQMTLTYRTDASENGQGFSVLVSTIQEALPFCDFTLPAVSSPSTLVIPRAPYSYPLNTTCHYLIVAKSPDLQIRADVLQSDVSQRNGSCDDGFVNAFDSTTVGDLRLPAIGTRSYTQCWYDQPTFVSGGQYLLLVFSTGSTMSGFRNGLTVTYRQGDFEDIYREGCGGEFHADDTMQKITVSQTKYIQEEMVCTWILRAKNRGHMVRMIASVDIDEQKFRTCTEDSLVVYDGDEQDSTKKLAMMCGYMTRYIQSVSEVLTVKLSKNYPDHDHYFQLQYFQTTEALPCAFEFNATSRHTYTNDSAEPYQPNSECTWLFRGDGDKIEISFSEHNSLYQQWDCTQQYVNVFDGADDSAPLIGQYCGDKPTVVTGSSENVFVKLTTGPSPVGRDFRLEYYTVAGVCAHEDLFLRQKPRHLTSINYPFNYINNLTCSWTVQVDTSLSSVVELEVIFSDLEFSDGCTKDKVEVFNGWSSFPDKKIGEFCGDEKPVFVSSENRVYITFHTDLTGTGRGFNLSYRAVPETATPVPTQPTQPPQPRTSNAGLIGGLVGGVLAVLLIIVIIVVLHFVMKSRSSKLIGTPQIIYSAGQASTSALNQNRNTTPYHPVESSSNIDLTSTPSRRQDIAQPQRATKAEDRESSGFDNIDRTKRYQPASGYVDNDYRRGYGGNERPGERGNRPNPAVYDGHARSQGNGQSYVHNNTLYLASSYGEPNYI